MKKYTIVKNVSLNYKQYLHLSSIIFHKNKLSFKLGIKARTQLTDAHLENLHHLRYNKLVKEKQCQSPIIK